MDHQELLTPQELATLCRVPLSSVYRWNHVGTGPPFVRLGKHCRYPIDGVRKWLEESKCPGRPAA